MKHPHHELIKQWADDTSRVVQFRNRDEWRDCDDNLPAWIENREYRFKPEKKPDVVEDRLAIMCGRLNVGQCINNLRLTFSGEDGKLIKAEVI